jgi:hypothetical protein
MNPNPQNNKINSSRNNPYKNTINNTNTPKLVNNTPQSGQSQNGGIKTSSIFGIVLLVVVVLLLIGAGYWAYNYYSTAQFQSYQEVEALADVKDAASKFSVGSNSIPSSKYSNEYSISTWVNIADYTYNYGKEKPIIRRGAAGAGNPEIVLDAKNNNLIVRMKLQRGSGNIVSKFADVSSKTVMATPVGINGPQDTSFNHPSANLGFSEKLAPISDNTVNYPITQLINSNDIVRMGIGSGMPSIEKINNNTAPVDSQIYQNDFFRMISGNEIAPKITNQPNAPIRESFADITGTAPATTDDLVNAMANVLITFCNIGKELSRQTTADNTITDINAKFDMLMNVLEASRTGSRNAGEVDNAVQNLFNSTSAGFTSSSNLETLITTLITDLVELQTVSNGIPAGTNIDNSAFMTAVNLKLSNQNCDIQLAGNNDVNMTVNLYENLFNLLRKSFYAYINNMGYKIRETYPEMAGAGANQPENCIACLFDGSSTGNTDPTIGECVVKMIPLQKWVNIIVSVYNQVVDVYIDGHLTSSCVLKGFPALSTSDVDITPDGGFSGQISRVVFSNTATTAARAQSIYYDGPIKTTGILSAIPNWVYYLIVVIIIISIAYSIFM